SLGSFGPLAGEPRAQRSTYVADPAVVDGARILIRPTLHRSRARAAAVLRGAPCWAAAVPKADPDTQPGGASPPWLRSIRSRSRICRTLRRIRVRPSPSVRSG